MSVRRILYAAPLGLEIGFFFKHVLSVLLYFTSLRGVPCNYTQIGQLHFLEVPRIEVPYIRSVNIIPKYSPPKPCSLKKRLRPYTINPVPSFKPLAENVTRL